MARRSLALGLQALAICSCFSPCCGESAVYADLFERFKNLQIDASRIAPVSGLTFTRDVGQFRLDTGKLYACAPVQGRICAAIFLGRGNFSFNPPTAIEKGQLWRFYGTHALSQDFNLLFMIFADTTFHELERYMQFRPGDVSGHAREALNYCLKYITDSDTRHLYSPIARAFLENESNQLFYSHLSESRVEPLFFEINPYVPEGVALLRRPVDTGMRHRREVVCQFYSPAQGIRMDPEQMNAILAPAYRIEYDFRKDLKVTAHAGIDLSFRESFHWIQLWLHPELEVDSLGWRDQPPVEYFKGKRNPYLWVECDPPCQPGEARTLQIAYHGDPVFRVGNYFHVDAPETWYPMPIYVSGWDRLESKSLFDITYHLPEPFDLSSIGRMLSKESRAGIVTSRWVTPAPMGASAFCIGFFEERKLDDERVPPIKLYLTENRYKTAGHVDLDIAESVALFQNLFGPAPFEELRVTEIPARHGWALPGYIALSSMTFANPLPTPEDEIFRAHEVAHQWWGTSVGFETYHDQWISEAFAQYSGLWYMQMKRGNEVFFQALRDWRENILNNRDYLLGRGPEAGPIWLGYRTGSSETAGDYDLVVYKKGAWVLHMLRSMLMDLNSLQEDKFFGIMREFFSNYNGESTTTDDFRSVVEKHAGQDMGWFFDQWIRETAIPTYKFTSRETKLDDGRYQVRCQVQQIGVPDHFQMYVPIRIDFENDRYTRVRAFLKGPFCEFDLPILPEKPKAIVFHDFESVLCRVEKGRWKD